MKRALRWLPALLVLALLAGCMSVPGEDTWDDEEDRDDVSQEDGGLDDALEGIFGRLEEGAKAHRWQILDAQGEALYTVSGEENVAAIDALVQGDGWEPAGEEEGPAQYTYVFWQEKTLLAGQDPEAEREYEALLRFSVPEEGNAVTLEILPESLGDKEIAGLDLGELLTVRSAVPEETAEALRNPAQWGE